MNVKQAGPAVRHSVAVSKRAVSTACASRCAMDLRVWKTGSASSRCSTSWYTWGNARPRVPCFSFGVVSMSQASSITDGPTTPSNTNPGTDGLARGVAQGRGSVGDGELRLDRLWMGLWRGGVDEHALEPSSSAES